MAVSGLGTIHVQLEKVSYSVGEQVNGFIYLNLDENYPSNTIYANIIGEEQVKFIKQEGDNSVTYKDEEKILDHEFPVFQFQGTFIPRGQYSFPVSFILPNYIPASFTWARSSEYAYTKYTMKAALPSPDPTRYPSVMSESNFFITNPDVMTPQKHTVLNKPITCCCCCGRGNTKLSVQFEKASFNFGDEAGIIVDIDNSQCGVAAKQIKASFVQLLLLKGKHARHFIKNEIGNVIFPGVKAGEVKRGIRIPLVISPLTAKTQQVVSPTSIGGLIKNTFFIEVKPVMATCICGSMPKTSIYVNVANRPKDFIGQPQMQIGITQQPSLHNTFSNENWKPQIMNGYVAEFKPEYAKSDLSHFNNNRFGNVGATGGYGMQAPNQPIMAKGKGDDYHSFDDSSNY